MRKFYIVFFLFNLLVSSWYIDIWQNANTTSRLLPVITYSENGSFRIDKYHELTCDKAYVNEHYYTDKAPLPTYVTIPFFWILTKTGIINPGPDGSLFGNHIYILGAILLGSLPFVLFIWIIFWRLRRSTSNISPVLLSMLPLYFSFFFIYAGTSFAHLFSGILLLGSYILLKRERFLLSGILSGLAFISEYNLAVIIFLWGILLMVRKRQLKPFLIFSLGILPSLVFIIYYNYIFSSSPFTFLYKHHNFSEISENYGFVLPGFSSVWGLSFSFYRGLFWYVPILFLFSVIILLNIKRYNLRNFISNYWVIPFIVYYLFIASYFAWWGGWTYGPRLLLGMLFILLFEAVIFISKQKIKPIFFWIPMVIGAVLIIPAKASIVYSAPTGINNPFVQLVVPKIMAGEFNPNNILTMAFGTNAGFSFFIFIAIFSSGVLLLQSWYKKCKPG
ncbi:MAG: hypothetical protein K8S16_16445 [Bacteroidales bacterium]|nr:hypothetical protein [Bacteroidales bacterium]